MIWGRRFWPLPGLARHNEHVNMRGFGMCRIEAPGTILGYATSNCSCEVTIKQLAIIEPGT